jgi:hypothetical protein
MFRDLQQQHKWYWPATITSLLSSSALSSAWWLKSEINWHTEFLPHEWQQWKNLARMLTSSTKPKWRASQKNHEERKEEQKKREKERERGPKGKKNLNKKRGKINERNDMEKVNIMIFWGQEWSHPSGVLSATITLVTSSLAKNLTIWLCCHSPPWVTQESIPSQQSPLETFKATWLLVEDLWSSPES